MTQDAADFTFQPVSGMPNLPCVTIGPFCQYETIEDAAEALGDDFLSRYRVVIYPEKGSWQEIHG